MFSSSSKGFHLGLQPAPAWTAILGLILFTALCILAHAGSIIRPAFPVGAFAVAIFLYWRYPILYSGFTWWMWFLTPWVRRLVDYQSGWQDPSLVLLGPYLVTMVSFATFVKHLPRSYGQGGLPFVLPCIGVFYGFFVGIIKLSPSAVVLPFMIWLAPILFGFHLFVNWRDYPSYRQNIQRTFLWGVLVMGVYGVLQYTLAPAWDRYWMSNAPIDSIGSPAPFSIRVFSTMNSPGPFAVYMMAGLLLLFNSQGPLCFPAAASGYLAFLLSLARSSWLGWIVGMLTLVTSLKARLQMRLIMTILAMAICVLPLINMEPFKSAVFFRLQSLSNPAEDVSYNERINGYQEAFSDAFSEVVGRGLGSQDRVENKYTIGVNDSAILPMFFSLGWFGTIPYLTGLALLLFGLLTYSEFRSDSFASAARAISFGIFVQFGLGTVMIAMSGVVFWGFLGIAMAAHKYYRHQGSRH